MIYSFGRSVRALGNRTDRCQIHQGYNPGAFGNNEAYGIVRSTTSEVSSDLKH
jgi:hypothetical protein